MNTFLNCFLCYFMHHFFFHKLVTYTVLLAYILKTFIINVLMNNNSLSVKKSKYKCQKGNLLGI